MLSSHRDCSSRRPTSGLAGIALALATAAGAFAQTAPAPLVCVSEPGGRQHCPADVSGGIALTRSLGSGSCLLGKSWGYDDQGVWVADGCGGEFVLGLSQRAAPPAVAAPAPVERKAVAEPAPSAPESVPAAEREKPTEPAFEPMLGEFTPGSGFLVGRTKLGELAISGYALSRYMNQNDDDQVFIDHLGNVRPVDPRNDLQAHRIMLFFKGWMGSPKLIYNITLWTVNPTDQRAIFANLGYQFSKKFSLYGGHGRQPRLALARSARIPTGWPTTG